METDAQNNGAHTLSLLCYVLLGGFQLLTSVLPAGDSWGILAFLCATLWNLPVVPALNSTDQVTTRQSIQQMYDLTRYLEHQLHTLAATYLNYLGPPFNEPDFDPPRIIGVEAVPSATVDIQEWHSLNDNARLAANYQAYSHLLTYLRTMDGAAVPAAMPALRHSLDHFRASLQGLLGSIGGIMASLGYSLPTAEPPVTPAPRGNFLRKMDDFWLLKELQTWLWRSAKDFNRLRKRVPPSAVVLHLETRGF
ncbi:cardiotrophin-like cytokine factor 1 [Elgaria multicarinata webbii]|uniref:cardiotrophin-like cytokine factor 1 n=1 Tax=Elgaria multicarinata webbii TaxID=159646 RepID=UPI002FCD2B56